MQRSRSLAAVTDEAAAAARGAPRRGRGATSRGCGLAGAPGERKRGGGSVRCACRRAAVGLGAGLGPCRWPSATRVMGEGACAGWWRWRQQPQRRRHHPNHDKPPLAAAVAGHRVHRPHPVGGGIPGQPASQGMTSPPAPPRSRRTKTHRCGGKGGQRDRVGGGYGEEGYAPAICAGCGVRLGRGCCAHGVC